MLLKNLLFLIALFAVKQVAFCKNQPSVNVVNPSCGCPYTETELKFISEEELSLHVDNQASYIGGEKMLNRYLDYIIQHPAKNRSDSTNYSIICRFIVERNGKISHIELLNHNEELFEKEAVKIIQAMPKWNPAQKDNKPVRSWYTLKFFFGYQNQE